MLVQYSDIESLPPCETRVVIINCGTKWVASLAYASAHRHVQCPIVVIDCESNDGSREHFARLADILGVAIDWIDWPLRPHPLALDDVFRRIPADNVLLMDSDLEICKATVFQSMSGALRSNANAYAAGFLHGPEWLGDEHGLPAYTGYYAERMWIPLVLMRTEPVRSALTAGFSFLNRRPYFEVPRAPRLSRLMGLRYRVVGLRYLPFPTFDVGNRPSIDGKYPAFVEFDTGADLHAQMLVQGFAFERLASDLWGGVIHHHGVTRANLAGGVRRVAKRLGLAAAKTETDQAEIREDVIVRLAAIYGVQLG